jgi:membrane-bound lytic murein transglycosylase F
MLGIVVVLSLVACTRIDAPRQQDELVVAVRNTPAFTAVEEEGGFEQDLISEFAREQGLKLRVILVRDHTELMALLKQGKVHFAASATISDDVTGIRYTAPLREARQLLVQHDNAILLDTPESLSGKQIEVLDGSPEAAALKLLKAGDKSRTPFVLAEQNGIGEIDLLERVSQNKCEIAATDSLHFDIAANFFPDLQVAQELPGAVRFAWAFPLDGDVTLFEKAQAFIARIHQDGTLPRLNDRYFGHIHRLDQAEIAGFLERVGSVLPHLRRDFIAAQELSGIDWRLLAALAYQESVWNPLATSPTNVRGIMMLTEDTADRMDVSNRLDARQSIHAGARYLADLIDDLPEEIRQPDRTWIGLASYNLGQGHMNGARAIAKGLKRDANSWYEMKQVLPLMAREEYYKRLKSGRARGGEAVIMVENVRTYYDILSRFEPAHKNGSPDYKEFKLSRCAPGQPCKEATLSAR